MLAKTLCQVKTPPSPGRRVATGFDVPDIITTRVVVAATDAILPSAERDDLKRGRSRSECAVKPLQAHHLDLVCGLKIRDRG
jgi:hypothetical protein